MIGIFDSGIGGLSVLKALRALMPEQNYFYLADSAYAPYGERDATYILERSRICMQTLLEQGCSLAVIACNTATAVAAHSLRQTYLHMPLVGIEPAIKPATALTRNGHIGVLATQGTLRSEKFRVLLTQIEQKHPDKHFHLHAPKELALAIEQNDTLQIDRTIKAACTVLSHHACDTVVLGCTHYPLVMNRFILQMEAAVCWVDPARAVALQTQKLLPEQLKNKTPRGALLTEPSAAKQGQVTYQSTGHLAALIEAAHRFL